jgi:hypothetical protein
MGAPASESSDSGNLSPQSSIRHLWVPRVSFLRRGKIQPTQSTISCAKRSRPRKTCAGLNFYPLPNKSVRVRIAGSFWLSRTGCPSPAADGLFRREPTHGLSPDRSACLFTTQQAFSCQQGQNTQSPGATPRKGYRIVEKRARSQRKAASGIVLISSRVFDCYVSSFASGGPVLRQRATPKAPPNGLGFQVWQNVVCRSRPMKSL